MKYSRIKAIRYVKKKGKVSKVKHHVVKNKKIVHVINGRRVKGIYYKGRFYSQARHLKKDHKKHHTIRHKGVDYHAVTDKISKGVHSAYALIKDKYRAYQERKAAKKYYKENLSLKERDQVQRDLSRGNPMAVKKSDNGESERLERQRMYDDKEKNSSFSEQ